MAVAIVILGVAGRLGWARTVFGFVTEPISREVRVAAGGIGGTVSTLGSIRQLAATNARLQTQVSQLQQQLSRDAELKEEDAALKRQLQFSPEPSAKLLSAQVIAYQPDNFRQFLTINRGSHSGLRNGMAVEADGVLVGQITTVNVATAEVYLVTDPNFRINGLDQSTRATGTVQGQLGSGLEMTKIAQSDQVHPGDTIITSGLGGDITKGIIIGQIGSVNQSDNQVFQTAQISSNLRVGKLELVFVVTGP